MSVVGLLILTVVLVSQVCVGDVSMYLLTCIEADTSVAFTFPRSFWDLCLAAPLPPGGALIGSLLLDWVV